ncbi:MAG: hypothetical protein R3F43_19570 [bacterium]
MTAGLSCPHTVRVFDFGQLADQTPYLAMELVDGETARPAPARRGRLPAGAGHRDRPPDQPGPGGPMARAWCTAI